MFWVAAGSMGDEGKKARQQLNRTLEEVWKLGFEVQNQPSFAKVFKDWTVNGA